MNLPARRNSGEQMKYQETISVAIVEDENDIRNSLAIIINGSPGFECVGAYISVEAALKEIDQQLPDVMLMDIALPGMSGIDGIPHIKKKLPEVDIMMLTVHGENDLIFRSLRAGACGYLLKNTPAVELLESIREVYQGGAPMSTRIARMVVASFQQGDESLSLTERQKEILTKLKEGKSYKLISDELCISPNTVKSHIKKIYQLLHVHNQAEAVAKALKNKLL